MRGLFKNVPVDVQQLPNKVGERLIARRTLIWGQGALYTFGLKPLCRPTSQSFDPQEGVPHELVAQDFNFYAICSRVAYVFRAVIVTRFGIFVGTL